MYRDIILDGRKIGSVNYKTGNYLDIMIDRKELKWLSNELDLKQTIDSELDKAFRLDPLTRGKMIEDIIARDVA